MNNYKPLAVINTISKYISRFYRGATRAISRISDTVRVHPALALRLSDVKGNKALVI